MRKIVFKKTSLKNDNVEYVDSTKCIAQIQNPKQGILPHDLIHAIVESSLNIRGFTDLIFAGEKPEYAMAADGEAWLSESMVEAIQGMLWSGNLNHAQFNDWIKTICEQRKISAIIVNEAQFMHLSQKLIDASKQWVSTPVGGSLEFEIV